MRDARSVGTSGTIGGLLVRPNLVFYYGPRRRCTAIFNGHVARPFFVLRWRQLHGPRCVVCLAFYRYRFFGIVLHDLDRTKQIWCNRVGQGCKRDRLIRWTKMEFSFHAEFRRRRRCLRRIARQRLPHRLRHLAHVLRDRGCQRVNLKADLQRRAAGRPGRRARRCVSARLVVGARSHLAVGDRNLGDLERRIGMHR